MKVLTPALLALCAALTGAAAETPASADVLLQTKHTTLALHPSGDTWLLTHYGARIEHAEDATALAWNNRANPNSLGAAKPATYSSYGSDNEGGMNKYGGLAVMHADGVVSTELHGGAPRFVPDIAGVTHLVLEMRDPVYPFFVTQHFRAVAASDVIETWVELRHTEPAPVRLVRMSSVALVLPALGHEFSVLSLTSQWGSEGRLAESPLVQGQTISLGSRSGVRDAWGNNPAFMLSIGERATETSGQVLAGALAWSGAWQISLARDQVDTIALTAGADTPSGPYLLEPGRTLTTPKMALTYSAHGKGEVSRNFHRWARDVQIHDGHGLRAVLLNSWEGAYFNFTEQTLTDMMDGVKQLGGELFVVDDGWFARGKYARNDDKRGLGDWMLNDAKLPHGLAWLAQQANSRGLRFGIWVEPEMANTTSELVDAHPDWVLREKTRALRQGRGGTQVVLDLTNPAVRDNLFQQLDPIIGTPGLSYIKWDANADFMNAGSAYLPPDRQTNLWFDYTTGLYALLERLRTKYPTFTLQGCSSGGGRMDYGFLHYADEFWTSDDTDPRQRVFIQWGAGQFYPALAMAAHVTVSPSHQTHRVTPLKFRFDVAMSGRLGFELHPKNMPPEDVAFAQKAVVDYKRIRPVVQQGNLYRLVSPWDHNYASLMYVSDDQRHAVVFVYGLTRYPQADPVAPVRLQGLAPDRQYRVAEIDRGKAGHVHADGKTVSGAALTALGLPFRLEGDYDSAVIELTAE